MLRGYAGTGKTFLSARLLEHVERSGLCWTVVAPTHKAVGVLRRQLENPLATELLAERFSGARGVRVEPGNPLTFGPLG